MSPQGAPGELAGILEALITAELTASPVLSSALGDLSRDGLLPDYSAGAIVAKQRSDDQFLQQLQAISETELTDPEDRADRDGAIAALRGRAVVRDWQEWQRSPDAYAGAGLNGVNTLFLNALRPVTELVEAAASRLRAVPELLAQGRANLVAELAHPRLVRRAIAQARGGETFAREQVQGLVSDDTHRRVLAEAGAIAGDAYLEWGTFLTGLAEQATGDFALGERRYDALLRDREGLSWSTRELRERGEGLVMELEAEMQRLTVSLGGDDWHQLVAELRIDAPETPAVMRAEYAAATEAARQFLIDHDLVTLPSGESCAVEPAPVFARAVLAVAFYSAPPPLAPGRPLGHFFVPTPPEDATAEAVTARLQTNSRFSIPTISVHEAYPGHHWQLAHVAATQPRLIRSVLRTPYFTEGWGLYAEQAMADAGFFTDPRHLLGQVEARLFRAARIVVDTSLHLGEMTPEQAVNYLTAHTSLTAGTAEAEVTRYMAWPTQAASYLTGALEIGRMAAQWTAAGGSLKNFHDRIGGSGGLPLAVAERLLTSGAGSAQAR